MTAYVLSLKLFTQKLYEKKRSLEDQLSQKRIAPLRTYLDDLVPILEKFLISYQKDLEQGSSIKTVTIQFDNISYIVDIHRQPQQIVPIIDHYTEQLKHLQACLNTFEYNVQQTIAIELLRGFYLNEKKLLAPPCAVFLVPHPEIKRVYDKLIFTQENSPSPHWHTQLRGPSKLSEIFDSLGHHYLNIFLVSHAQQYPLIDTTAYVLLKKYKKMGNF